MSGHEQRPWPVVLLTALGAWLAAVPLTAMLMMLLGPVLRVGPVPLLLGAAALALSVAALRRGGLPLFLEQLAVPGLLIGGGCLVYGLNRLGVQTRPLAALTMVVALGVAALVPLAWLRLLLGALAAGLAGVALNAWESFFTATRGALSAWLSLHLLLSAWVALRLAPPRGRQLREDLATGWLAALLLMLCAQAGQSFLVGGLDGHGGMSLHPAATALWQTGAGSALLALAAAAVALRRFPALRRMPPLLAAAPVVIGLAALMPSLGGVLLALALTAGAARRRQAVGCGLAAAWVIGAFYYQLHWPLAHKAALLGAAGALLMGLGWRLLPQRGPAVSARDRGAQVVLLGGVAATLALVNASIWQKEALIAEGRPVFIALAPVDPRSLMQGDYMRLRFAMPRALEDMPGFSAVAARPRVVARRDARGVAVVQDLYAGRPPAAGELLIELTPRDGGWVIVTDAWFFREGEGQRFEAAKYGEFRVLPDGRALLVGLAGADLVPIK